MEIKSDPDFIEKPVIDIQVEFAGGDADRDMAWTINDEPASSFSLDDSAVSFRPDPNTLVVIQAANTNWLLIRHRIDRIPTPVVIPKPEDN